MIAISPVEEPPSHISSTIFDADSNVGRLYILALGAVIANSFATKSEFWDVWVPAGEFEINYNLTSAKNGAVDEITIRMGDEEATIYRYGGNADFPRQGLSYTIVGSEELVTLAVMHLLD